MAPRPGLDEDQVVTAAAALADEHGLAATTLARLARELGVRPPSLYNHVAGHEALVRLLAVRAADGLAERLADAAAGRSGPEALAATAHAYRAFAHERPGLYETAVRAPLPGDERHAAAAQRVLDVLSAALRAWRLEGDDLVDALRIVRSALHGFVTLEAGEGFRLGRDRSASFEALIASLAAGLDAAAPRSSANTPEATTQPGERR